MPQSRFPGIGGRPKGSPGTEIAPEAAQHPLSPLSPEVESLAAGLAASAGQARGKRPRLAVGVPTKSAADPLADDPLAIRGRGFPER